MRLLYCLWSVLNAGVSAILSLVGHIQLTEAPSQEQLETISSSRLMKGTFLLSFKGVTSKSARSETEKVQVSGCRSSPCTDVVLVVHYEMFQLKPWEDILSYCSQIDFILFFFFMKGWMLGVICRLRYFRVGSFISEGVVEKIRNVSGKLL